MNDMRDYADIISLVISASLLFLYHLYLHNQLKRNPHYTIQAVNRYARAQWVHAVMSDEGKLVLGVQTLRNSTMAATFMASTAVLLIIGTLNLSSDAGKLVNTWHLLNFGGSHHVGFWMVKLLFLISNFFVA